MTLTLADALLLVIASTLLVMTIQLMRLAGRISEAAGELRDAIKELRPDLRRLVRNAEEALADVRRTSGRIDRIAETIEDSATLARQLLTPLSTRLGALMIGVKTALTALRRGGSPHGNGVATVRED